MKHLVEYKPKEWSSANHSLSACGIWLLTEEETHNNDEVECGNCKRTQFYKEKLAPPKEGE